MARIIPTHRTASEQATVALANALRALDMAPLAACSLIPHPSVVARAQIVEAMRYLAVGAQKIDDRG